MLISKQEDNTGIKYLRIMHVVNSVPKGIKS
jgi:hypothetical protein